MKNYCLVSIAWKSIQNIKNVIDDAYNSSHKPKEVIIIINPYNEQDTTEIRNYIKSEKRVTRWIDCSENIGCALAWNVGMFSHNCEYCIVVNDDCRVGLSTYENMMKVLSQDGFGLVGVQLGGWPMDKVKTPMGFLFGVSKSALNMVGGFKEIASPLADEVELGLRIASAGFKVGKAENCTWFHIHDISNNFNQPIKYLGNYINVRKNQLEIEHILKSLQEKHNLSL